MRTARVGGPPTLCLLGVLLCLMAACSRGHEMEGRSPGPVVAPSRTHASAPPTPTGCVTTTPLVKELPDQLVQQLGPGPVPKVVGTGKLYVLAPVEGTWGDAAEQRAGGFYLKLGLWVGTDQRPEISVRSIDGGKGRVEQSPTADGLPGFLPTGVFLPTAGCWQVIARVGADVVEIQFAVE